MNHQPSTSPKSASANGCCGGAGAKDKLPIEANKAKRTANPLSAARPEAAKSSGSCCGGGAEARPDPDAPQARS